MAKSENNPNVCQLMNKMWYILTVDLAVKKNELTTLNKTATWMNLETMLNEKGQTHKVTLGGGHTV